MPINWTKKWEGSDDGTIVKAIDLKNIQEDMAGVLTTSDVGDTAILVFWENDVLSWENEAVLI